ncbi:response regulator [Christiangramia sediminis]|uniref:Response regulator n=1 Tax=Christiangramia sediminis TaxID=2881336 RepID=A0A9X1LHG3_9FLAO|nr:response regulator [Christiangramia sediminis]MCB7480464.1 response regulator [Christiangramia sediminis]
MNFKKIFLVDDEDIINAIQTKIVKSEFPEYEILKFGTAKELLSVLKEINYKPLIFLDLNMPVMDAIDFLNELDNQEIKVEPIIFILTFSQNPVEINFVNNHPLVYDVIYKPMDQQKINAVKKLLIS